MKQNVQMTSRDRGTDWGVLIPSIAATTIIGCALELNGVALHRAEFLAVAAGATTFFMREHAADRNSLLARSTRFMSGKARDLLLPLLTIPAATAAVFALSTFSPELQASVLNKRLAKLLRDDDRPEARAKAAEVLRTASSARVKLHPALVSQVLDQSKQASDPEGWSAFLAAVNYQISNNDPAVPQDARAGDQFDLGSNNTFGDFRLTGYKIVYHGGPITLRNATFRDCTFEVDESENGRKLLQAVLATAGTGINLELH